MEQILKHGQRPVQALGYPRVVATVDAFLSACVGLQVAQRMRYPHLLGSHLDNGV